MGEENRRSAQVGGWGMGRVDTDASLLSCSLKFLSQPRWLWRLLGALITTKASQKNKTKNWRKDAAVTLFWSSFNSLFSFSVSSSIHSYKLAVSHGKSWALTECGGGKAETREQRWSLKVRHKRDVAEQALSLSYTAGSVITDSSSSVSSCSLFSDIVPFLLYHICCFFMPAFSPCHFAFILTVLDLFLLPRFIAFLFLNYYHHAAVYSSITQQLKRSKTASLLSYPWRSCTAPAIVTCDTETTEL